MFWLIVIVAISLWILYVLPDDTHECCSRDCDCDCDCEDD